jgi:hypothetical protein
MMIEHSAHIERANHSVTADADEDQLLKLIRKLRWIGLDDEAQRLQDSLRILSPEHRSTIVADSNNTD